MGILRLKSIECKHSANGSNANTDLSNLALWFNGTTVFLSGLTCPGMKSFSDTLADAEPEIIFNSEYCKEIYIFIYGSDILDSKLLGCVYSTELADKEIFFSFLGHEFCLTFCVDNNFQTLFISFANGIFVGLRNIVLISFFALINLPRAILNSFRKRPTQGKSEKLK